MPALNVASIPGYLDAVHKEQFARDEAFLGITKSVAGFELVPMTLWHFLVLRVTRNPLLWGGMPTPAQLRDFLWLLSPGYRKTGGWRKWLHNLRCRWFMPPKYLALWNTKRARAGHIVRNRRRHLAAAQVLLAVHDYATATFMDRPSCNQHGFAPDYYSDAAFFCMMLGRECGWSQKESLKTPMRRIFQYANEMKQHYSSKVPLDNPSDRLRAEYFRNRVNQQPRG